MTIVDFSNYSLNELEILRTALLHKMMNMVNDPEVVQQFSAVEEELNRRKESNNG